MAKDGLVLAVSLGLLAPAGCSCGDDGGGDGDGDGDADADADADGDGGGWDVEDGGPIEVRDGGVEITDDGGTFVCHVTICAGHELECGNCRDDDGDGHVDWRDRECLGPCDNTEGPALNADIGGVPGADGGVQPPRCDPGVRECGQPGDDQCPQDYYCVTGCCQPTIY